MTFYLKSIHPSTLANWKAELDALPERKKSKWSTIVMNLRGTYRKVRFYKGYFEIKLNASSSAEYGTVWPKDGWAPIIPLRGQATFEQIERCYGARMAQDYVDNTLAGTVLFGRLDGMTEEEALTPEGWAIATLAATQTIVENHTGAHYRNHSVSVPVAAGQPVRG